MSLGLGDEDSTLHSAGMATLHVSLILLGPAQVTLLIVVTKA